MPLIPGLNESSLAAGKSESYRAASLLPEVRGVKAGDRGGSEVITSRIDSGRDSSLKERVGVNSFSAPSGQSEGVKLAVGENNYRVRNVPRVKTWNGDDSSPLWHSESLRMSPN